VTNLDDAYANRTYIDGADDFPPRWDAAAAAFRQALGNRAQLGLAYGSGPRNGFDLFTPDDTPHGTLVFVHGGYWRMFDRSTWSHFASAALARGWAVAMPSYDLCPDVRITDITCQISAAVQAIAARTRGPISLTGHSAGGHLVARMLDPQVLPYDVARRLDTVVPISPLSDLRPLLQTSMNDDFRLTPETAAAESPIFTTDRHPARAAVWVGADERPAFLDQAGWLSEAWDIDMCIAPAKHHFDVIDALRDPESTLMRLLTDT